MSQSPESPFLWRPRVLAAAVLLLVGVSGVLGGMSLERWLQVRRFDRGGPPPMLRGGRPDGERGFGRGGRGGGPSRMREEFGRELQLTPQQQVQIDSIFATQVRAMQAIQESSRPRADSVIERTRAAIRRLLTPEQQMRFDSLRARRHSGPRRP